MTEGKSRLASLPAWVPVLVPIVISVVSLVVSIIGLVISLMLPQAHLELPFYVRVQQGEEASYGAGLVSLFVQPSFVSTSSNTRAEVVEDLELVVKPEQGKPVEFIWVDQGEWIAPDPAQVQDSSDLYAQYYKVTSDPTPLVINPGAAVVPVLRFTAPTEGFQFKEGSYELTLTANRAVVSEPLEDKMTITFTEVNLEQFQRTKGAQWQIFWDAARVREQYNLVEKAKSQP